MGHLSYFTCKHFVKSPHPITVEMTHQLIDFFSVPLCMTKILGAYTQAYSHGHLLGFSKRVSFDVFKVAKTVCCSPAPVRVLLSQPQHLGRPPAVCNFRMKILARFLFNPGRFLS